MKTTDGTITITNHGEDSELHCPRCGSNYLHQADTIIYERGEDATQTVKITVSNSITKTEIVQSAGSGNPSRRRHGMAILFNCENCNSFDNPPELELTISQHKGSTLLAWQYPPQKND